MSVHMHANKTTSNGAGHSPEPPQPNLYQKERFTMNMSNIPDLKCGIISVSRDCFIISLSENRRQAIVSAYEKKYGNLYEVKKTVENDGYEAVQLGFGDVKVQRVNKPMMGHFKKNDVAPKKTLKEFKLDDISSVNVGDTLKADIFAVGEKVDVIGTSKGKGTAGAIKRWNFSRLKESHGTGPVARHAGSLGACSDPSRVYKGKKLAGHLGCERVTIQNLDVAKIDADNNLIAIKGAIPGPKGGIVVIRNAKKA